MTDRDDKPAETKAPQWSPALTALRRDIDNGTTEWRWEFFRDALAR